MSLSATSRMSFKYLQGWRQNPFTGHHVPGPDNRFSEFFFFLISNVNLSWHNWSWFLLSNHFLRGEIVLTQIQAGAELHISFTMRCHFVAKVNRRVWEHHCVITKIGCRRTEDPRNPEGLDSNLFSFYCSNRLIKEKYCQGFCGHLILNIFLGYYSWAELPTAWTFITFGLLHIC